MLLNSFGQPTILTRENTYLNIEEFKESPLLLCHKNSLRGKLLPKNWSGCLYASHNILDDIKVQNYKISNQTFSQKYVWENKTESLTLNDNINKSLHLDNKIELTMIPLDENNLMYILQDDNVTNLLADDLSEYMEAFVCNKILRKYIKDGIDVLYINDGVYQNSSYLPIFPSECLLGALTTIVRPRYVVGLSGNDLPQHIKDCCRPKDVYSGY